MKNILMLLCGVLLLASCSTPKYAYHFDHYDYNSGKKKANPENVVVASQGSAVENEILPNESPLTIEKEAVVASIENNAAVPAKVPAAAVDKKEVAKKYSELTKAEKKEFRQALKKEVKNYMKAKKAGDNGAAAEATKVMDYNLKMAIIFGAVALTLSFFGGVNSVFWIASVIMLVIGVVFFIKWIAEQ